MGEIRTLVTREKKINAEVIELLKEWLAMAEQGEIIEVAIGGIDADRQGCSACSTTKSGSHIVGVLEMLKHRILSGHD